MQPSRRIEAENGPAADDMDVLDGEVRRIRVLHLHVWHELMLCAIPSLKTDKASLAERPSGSLSIARRERAPVGAGLELDALAVAPSPIIEGAPQHTPTFGRGEDSVATAALRTFDAHVLQTTRLEARGLCQTLLKRRPDLGTLASVDETKLVHCILLGNKH